MESIIEELQDIMSDIDYGDITRNVLNSKLDGILLQLEELNIKYKY